MNTLPAHLQMEIARGLVALENKNGKPLSDNEVKAYLAGFHRCRGAWRNADHVRQQQQFIRESN